MAADGKIFIAICWDPVKRTLLFDIRFSTSNNHSRKALSFPVSVAFTGRPVTVTVGTVWRLSVTPPPRPPRLSVGVVIARVVFTLIRIIFGVVYYKECPQQPNIPVYLLGLALIPLFINPYVTQPQEHPRGFESCMQGLLGLFAFVWILMGDVWVFSVYQPNYDPNAADGLYCNKTLYTFAFWNAVLETFVIGVFLGQLCRGLLCYITLTPESVNRDFYV